MDALETVEVQADSLDTVEAVEPVEPAKPEPVKHTAFVNAGELLDCLAAAKRAASTRPVNPLLTHLQVKLEGSWLTVAGTDGELMIKRSAPAVAGWSFEFLAPAKLFHDTVKQLMGGRAKAARAQEIELVLLSLPAREVTKREWDPDQRAMVDRTVQVYNHKLTVSIGGRSMELTALQDDSYPAMPDGIHTLLGFLPGKVPLTRLPAATVKRALELTAFAPVKDSSTGAVHYTQGLLVEYREGSWRLVGTDGHRLTYCRLDGAPLPELMSFREVMSELRKHTDALVSDIAGCLAEIARLEREHSKRTIEQREREQSTQDHMLNNQHDRIERLEKCLAELAEPDYQKRAHREANEPAWIIPVTAALELEKLLPKDEEAALEVHAGQNRVYFSWVEDERRTTFQIAELDVKYPPYERVIPNETSAKVHFERDRLAEALKAAALAAKTKDDNPVIYLTAELGAEVAEISAESAEGAKYREQIPAEVAGENVKIALNPQYMLDVLKVLKAEQVTVNWLTDVSPITVTSPVEPWFIYIQMPIRMD